jgi:hypothetical protein
MMMEMAVRSMEMTPGALPCPLRVPKHRLLSSEICLQRRRRCGTVLGKTLIVLVFSVPRLLIGEKAVSEVGSTGLTMGRRGQGLGRAPPVVSLAPGPPPSHLRSS